MPGNGFLQLLLHLLLGSLWKILVNIQSILKTLIGTSYHLPILMDMPTHSLMTDYGEKQDLPKELKGTIALVLI